MRRLIFLFINLCVLPIIAHAQLNPTDIRLRGKASPGVSPAGWGYMYFDRATNKFKCSQNGSAYTDCVGGGGGGGAVDSVYGRTGVVVAATNDYSFSQISGSVSDGQLSANVPLKNAANTFTAFQTINPGTTSADALFLGMNLLVSNGSRDSHKINFRGTARQSGVDTTVDWRQFVDVTDTSGSSSLLWQHRVNSDPFATVMELIADGSGLFITGDMTALRGVFSHGLNVSNILGGTALTVDPPPMSAGAEISNQIFSGNTVTITGNYAAHRFTQFDDSVITAASGLTVTNSATVAIAGPPVASGSAVITNPYSLWVESGNVLFGGLLKLGSGPTTINDAAGKILSAALNTVAVAQGGTGVTSLSDLLGTTNQVNVSGGTARIIGGNVTLSLPQSIATTSTPQFGALGIGIAATSTGILQANSIFLQGRNAANSANINVVGLNSDNRIAIAPSGQDTILGGQLYIPTDKPLANASSGNWAINVRASDDSASWTTNGNLAIHITSDGHIQYATGANWSQLSINGTITLDNTGQFLSSANNARSVAINLVGLNASDQGSFMPGGQQGVFGGAISTADPTSGAGPTWKFGSKKTATVTLVTTDYVEVNIGGVIVKLAIVN